MDAMPPVDKVIVTNRSALQRKYGANWVSIQSAANALIAKDTTRGLTGRLVFLDDAADMGSVGGTAVGLSDNPPQNKTAVNAVVAALSPTYVMLLGATDVVPHQDLANPAFGGGSLGADPDATAWSDLPYASDAPYSQAVVDFLSPAKWVGRLPDVTGGNDTAYLVGLLNTAKNFGSQPLSRFTSYLGLSRRAWSGSTTASLTSDFGNAANIHLIPGEHSPWSAGLLGNRSHFINCEGAPYDPNFYGADSHGIEVALDATELPLNITEGTVIAAECCYGADLYDPAINAGRLSACYTYLANGAYGFFGSSTIAYGQATFDDQADLICVYFFQYLLASASLGEAALQARLKYVQTHPTLSATDLKTLAQFNLMGDPSVRPVHP